MLSLVSFLFVLYASTAYLFICCFFFFFCTQKTSYELRFSDWSSDVCSSDLLRAVGRHDALADELAAAAVRPSDRPGIPAAALLQPDRRFDREDPCLVPARSAIVDAPEDQARSQRRCIPDALQLVVFAAPDVRGCQRVRGGRAVDGVSLARHAIYRDLSPQFFEGTSHG